MIVRLVGLFALLSILSTPSLNAESAPSESERIAALERRASDLQKKVDKIGVDVNGLTKAVETFDVAVDKLTNDTERLSQNLKAVTDRSSALAGEVRALRERVDTVSELVKEIKSEGEGIAQVRQELQAVNRTLSSITEDDGSGNHILALNNTMKSRKGRDQVADAVHEAMKHTGTLRIRNTMAFDQRVAVNGRVYTVRRAQTMVLSGIPVGTVALELVGVEGPRNWTIAPPDYEQTVDIVPRVSAAPVIYVETPLLGMR